MVHFAKPVSVYDNWINKCVGRYCHCEISVKMDAALFSVMVDSAISEAYAPAYLEKILKKTKRVKGKLHFCFYVLLNDYVDIRFFNDLGDDFYNPVPEVYDTIEIEIDSMQRLKDFVVYNLCQLGKSYDLCRAVCLYLPFTLRTHQPDKFFCSQLVMHSLNHIDITTDQDINHMKPDDVYDWLTIKVANNASNGSSKTRPTNHSDNATTIQSTTSIMEPVRQTKL